VLRSVVEAKLVQTVDERPSLIGLSGAPLSDANLSGVPLSRADLRDADLSGVIGINNAQLEYLAFSLEGATMPNGQKYEDWLRSKGRAEDGENSIVGA
jgi:hypothetical protein